MAVWLGKTEPFKFSWDDLVRQGSTFWDGVRSAQVTQWLRQQGWTNVVSMAGGIDAWAQVIDASVGRY